VDEQPGRGDQVMRRMRGHQLKELTRQMREQIARRKAGVG